MKRNMAKQDHCYFFIESEHLQTPTMSVSTATTSADEGSAVSGTDAALSSLAAEDQVQKLQAEVEQLRKALTERDQDNLALHAENEQLQADLLRR